MYAHSLAEVVRRPAANAQAARRIAASTAAAASPVRTNDHLDGGPSAAAEGYHPRMALPTVPAADTADRTTSIELLGLAAQVEHTQFTRLAAYSRVAPGTAQRLALAHCAAERVDACDRLLARVSELGGDPEAAMGSWAHVMDGFDARTTSTSWAERLLVPYIGYGVTDDFCRLAADGLDAESRELMCTVLTEQPSAALAVSELDDVVTRDHVLTARLALWGRRLVGEALTVVQSVLEQKPGLEPLVGVGRGALFGKLTAEHARRMGRLKLTA